MREVSAGLLVTVAAVPLAIGLADVAGVPPVAGLLTCIWPLVVFALLGSSPHLKLGMDASSALLIAATVPALVAGSPDEYVAVAAGLTLLSGGLILAAGVLRVGVVADLLSLPVLVGYTAGIAISVMISQLPRMLGYDATGGNDVQLLANTLGELGSAHGPTVATAAVSFAALVALRRALPAVPAGAVVLVVGIALSSLLDLAGRGVATVGTLPSGLPAPSIPGASAATWGELIVPAVGVAIVIAADSMITSRSFATRLHYHLDTNRDLVGLGAANVASALTGGVAASASYSRTAIAERNGSRSQLAGVVAAGFMALVLLVLTGALAPTPLALLSAVVVDALVRLADPRAFAGLARVRRVEVGIAVLTTTGVLVVGLLPTILVAVGCVLLLALSDLVRAWRGGREEPRHPRLGRFVPDDGVGPALRCAWHGPLVFLNVERFRRSVLDVTLRTPDLRTFVLDAGDVTMLDATAAGMLAELETAMRDRGIGLTVDGLAEPFARRLAASRVSDRRAGDAR